MTIGHRDFGAGIASCAAVAFAACMLVAASAEARAADASPWVEDSHAAVRLISGLARKGGKHRAGVEIRLEPGWHTYWRYPGDSGVPPRFDFSKSTNLAAAEVLYPAPQLFTDETGNSIGYTDNVIFPVHLTPRDPAEPVTLRLKLDYAVCEKLCVPVEAQLSLEIFGDAKSTDAALAAAEARVPKPVAASQLGLSARRVNDGPKPLVAVDLKAPEGKPVNVFVEGPAPEWALPVPKPAQGAPAGRRHFGFELDGLPPGADPKSPVELTFTVVQGDQAFETRAKLQ